MRAISLGGVEHIEQSAATPVFMSDADVCALPYVSRALIEEWLIPNARRDEINGGWVIGIDRHRDFMQLKRMLWIR